MVSAPGTPFTARSGVAEDPICREAEMPRPRVYIHRVEWCPYDVYMDEANLALLDAFADVVNDGERTEAVSPEEMAARLSGVQGILSLNGAHSDELTGAALERAGTVEVIAVSHWWGQHNTMAPVWAEAGAKVIDASDACNEAVAEWALGAVIAGLRKFDYYDREMKSGTEWPTWRHTAGQLNGSTISLIGLGRVGRIMARYLEPFDCRVLAYDPYFPPAEAQALGVELVGLDEALTSADVVSLHAPVTAETRGMIGERELSLLKDGGLLVNSARAALLDNEAFRRELASGRIRAYIDVFEPEPPPLDDVLRGLENVVMTPHVAGTTTSMFLRCGRRAVGALRDYFSASG
jgi:phosphoglycerate dehydrogenase-like enzyme